MDDSPIIWFLLIMFIVFACLAGGYHCGKKSIKETAVKAGMAEWVVVDPRGSIEFHWKTNSVK